MTRNMGIGTCVHLTTNPLACCMPIADFAGCVSVPQRHIGSACPLTGPAHLKSLADAQNQMTSSGLACRSCRVAISVDVWVQFASLNCLRRCSWACSASCPATAWALGAASVCSGPPRGTGTPPMQWLLHAAWPACCGSTIMPTPRSAQLHTVLCCALVRHDPSGLQCTSQLSLVRQCSLTRPCKVVKD